ncbi:MAG: exodeoxyribonuclease VII small subunit [Oscillospiraceae bacterium]
MKFEESINKINEIISALEDKEISLDDSIELYKEGAKLIESCKKELDKAEMLVTVDDTDE